jgi:hypothetical protein
MKDALFFSGYGPEDFYRNYGLKRVLENPRFSYFFPKAGSCCPGKSVIYSA